MKQEEIKKMKKTLNDKIQEYENWLNHLKQVINRTENGIRVLELKAQEQVLETIVKELKNLSNN